MSENAHSHDAAVKPRRHNGIVKRAAVVAVIIGVLLAIVMVVDYLTTPDIRFTLKGFDCSASAIEARNKLPGNADEDACIIDITIKNLESEGVTLDLAELSGPGPADFGGESLIRIYDANGKFCYGSASYLDLRASESKDITLTCRLDERHSGINDLSIDSRPAYVVIDYNFSKTRIDLSPED